MGCRMPAGLNRFHMVYLTDSPENRVLVQQAFEIMEADGTVETVFYDGSVETPQAFAHLLFRPGTLPFALFDDYGPIGLSWVNEIVGKAGHGHFVAFKRAWGRRNTVRMARLVFEYLLNAKDAGGYLFDVLLGICPESNALVWKLGEVCGAVRRCVIPHYIYRHATGQTENALLYTVTRDSLHAREGD